MKKNTRRVLLCLVLTALVTVFLFACEKNPASAPYDSDSKSNGTLDVVPPDNKGDDGHETGDTSPDHTDGTTPPDDGKSPYEGLSREEFYAQKQLIIYRELPDGIIRNFDYKVTVTQGDKTAQIPVYNHAMEYDAEDRSIGGDLYRRFSQFAFSGEQVRIDIKVNRDFEYYSVIPSAKNFETSFRDGVISVYLDEPDYFGIRLDDDDNSIISVFADLPEYPEDIPSKNGDNVLYVDDWYETDTGLLIIGEENTTVYIAPGAVLNARVKLTGANSSVIGRGIILDPFTDFYNYDILIEAPLSKDTKLCTLAGEGSLYDGPVIVDARGFNLITSSKNITVRNYKALSTMMCSDGITASSADSTFEHCWIYCGDNALVISGARNQTYSDITIGTTCAAVFPQLSTVNVSLEGIYIFRTNDGVINNRYNSGAKERDISLTIKNLDCMDCINVPRFYQGGNMGTLEKTIRFDGVSLPTLSGVTDPHASKTKTDKGFLVQFTNPNNIFTENYTLNLHNVYVDGKPVTSAEQASLSGTEYKNTLNFTNDGKYTPVERTIYEVGYTAQGKVYIGSFLQSFEKDILQDGDDFLLPAEEIARMLRCDKTFETVDKNSVAYVNAKDLTTAGAAASADIKNGTLYLVPVYSGENLIGPDHIENSRITENPSYQVDMVIEGEDGDYTYSFYSNKAEGYYSSGFNIMFAEEIKKYGAGEYEFSFRLRASSSVPLLCTWRYDTPVSYTKQATSVTASSTWKDVSITLKVTEEMLESELFAFSVKGTGTAFDYFAVKDLELAKKQ